MDSTQRISITAFIGLFAIGWLTTESLLVAIAVAILFLVPATRVIAGIVDFINRANKD
jgi:uncharacterized membrane protein YjjP (DUF1212 family)